MSTSPLSPAELGLPPEMRQQLLETLIEVRNLLSVGFTWSSSVEGLDYWTTFHSTITNKIEALRASLASLPTHVSGFKVSLSPDEPCVMLSGPDQPPYYLTKSDSHRLADTLRKYAGKLP